MLERRSVGSRRFLRDGSEREWLAKAQECSQCIGRSMRLLMYGLSAYFDEIIR